ncbi:transforming acidic coiled-coil-containing protein 3 [Osmia bicornis bicornis]|uniref:transforming acidic coiled-coil-containing protein 3 n=1 Tax=Osmia bicornis bicornis TaxID=1437191 RepID=UPI0010F6D117|nr:transforming acidic coiled-coil-containing protein 3 [Osmia bicornis bicornis]
MSSPRSIGSTAREGTRVVLREITASLHNSSPVPLRFKSGNDSPTAKTAEHEVKVRFAREFADVGSITYPTPDSLSSAGSFQSLNSSLSAKSSNGVNSPDSLPYSPSQTVDSSYVNPDISGLDDLILGCADIHLNNSEEDQSSQDLSQDQTFASATDDLQIDRTSEFSLTDSQNGTEIIENESTTRESTRLSFNRTQDIQDRPILLGTVCIRQPLPVALITNNRYNRILKPEESIDESISPDRSNDDSSGSRETGGSPVNSVDEVSLPRPSPEDPNLNLTTCLSLSEEISDICKQDPRITLESTSVEVPLNVPNCPLNSAPLESSSLTEHEEFSLPGISTLAEHVEGLSLPSIPTLSSFTVTDSSGSSGNDSHEDKDNAKNLLAKSSSPVSGSVAVTASPQDALKESPIREVQNKSLEEAISPSPYDAANGEESCADNLNDTPVSRPKTPEVQQNSEETNVHSEVESTNIVVKKLELSTPQEASLEVNVSPSEKEEVEDNKLNESPDTETIECSEKVGSINLSVEEKQKENEEEFSEEKLDRTLTLQDISFNAEAVPDLEQYTEFKPQRQSTSLDTLCIEQPNFEDLKSAAEQVANDIFKSSLEFSNETDHFVSATSDLFQDPKSFDFLIAHGNSKKNTINRLRAESLYVKFDPLVSDTSMLPQGNTQPINEEQNGKNENSSTNISTPKCNPAIAAIDRLLYFSPIATRNVQKMEEPREKIEQPTEEPKSDIPLITDINMSKELELVKSTVLQLEEELEKQKKEHEAELERQKNSFQEKINKLQAQLAQEVKSKSQMTVVVEEYEKSISRLFTEKERDRTNFEQEKAKIQEELQATNVHLTNTEAAFNDVHQKYERLKGVVSAYKSNETVLKESIEENMETIKGLETRYDQLKNHAMTQLEKANFELDAIRKQHEDETVKLHAMVRKAELKSNSLAELVEQKTKENKELTQILDEVIARVGHQNAE